jgi:hypothetical protein
MVLEIPTPAESDVNTLLAAFRAGDYRGFADRYQQLPELDAMVIAWKAADGVRGTDQFPEFYRFAVGAQREGSVRKLWGGIPD